MSYYCNSSGQGTNGAFPGLPQQKLDQPYSLYPSGSGGPQPSSGAPYPTGGTPYLPNNAPYPSGGSSYPQYSNTGASYPPSHAPYPSGGAGYPPSHAPYPSGGAAYPPSHPPFPSGGAAYPPSHSPYPSGGSSMPFPSGGSSMPFPSGGSNISFPSGGASYPPNNAPYSAVANSPSGVGYNSSMSMHQAPSRPPRESFYCPKPNCCNKSHPPGDNSCSFCYNQSSVPTCGTKVKQLSPTVTPAHPFNARGDAEAIRKAMKGFGTDEKTIIEVLTNRSLSQRLEIEREFKTLYGKDMIKDLKSELSGNFENLVLALMTPLPVFYAKELQEAISGAGTDEDVLIEVLCTMSNQEIHEIRQAFHHLYRAPLESEIKDDTSGTFKRLMVSLCNANRDESMVTNPDAATADAQTLLRAGELRMGTDESSFIMVLCQRNHAQLRMVFDEYQRMTGHSIEKAIKKEFSGNSEEALLGVVEAIRNKPLFFAKCLHKSMKGFGTNDSQLIRNIVGRVEIDMGAIKQEYQNAFGKSLATAIEGDTSGHYKKCLLALIH